MTKREILKQVQDDKKEKAVIKRIDRHASLRSAHDDKGDPEINSG